MGYAYDEGGLRVRNTDHPANVTTCYVGGVVYDNEATAGGAIVQKEVPLQASGRIGVYRTVENRYEYELTDHLGNVRAVISGIKVNAQADVLEYADYYAMGGVARSGGTMQYRHGYQGQYAERDRETEWNSFELRQYDAVTGRWLSPDPYGQYHSPYMGMGNDWANQADPDGGWSGTGAAIGAVVGFGVGAAVGAIKDPDNWFAYAVAGAVGGLVGGGLAGNTTRADNNPGGRFSAGGGSHGMTLTASTSTSFSMVSVAGAASGLVRGLMQQGPSPYDSHYFPAVKEAEAYRFMHDMDVRDGREVHAWLVENKVNGQIKRGVLVMPWVFNGPNHARWKDYYDESTNMITDHTTSAPKSYKALAVIHTHSDGDATPSRPDISIANKLSGQKISSFVITSTSWIKITPGKFVGGDLLEIQMAPMGKQKNSLFNYLR